MTSEKHRNEITLLERRYAGEHPLRTLVYLYHGNYRRLLLGMLFYIIKHSGVWTLPVITASIIDIITAPESHDLNALWVLVGIQAFLFALNVPVHYLYIMQVSKATRLVEMRLRAALAKRLQHLSMNFYTRSSTGTLQTKLLRDVEIIQQLTMQMAQILPSAGITLVFAVVTTALRAPGFLIFYLLTVPTAVLVVSVLRRPIARRNRDFRLKVEDMSSSLIAMIQLIPVTRAHGIEHNALRHVERKLERVQDAGVRLDTINALFGASAWLTFRLFETLALAIASYAAFTGRWGISVGDVVMLTGFFTALTNAVLMFTNLLPEVSRGFESIYSIGEVLESPDLEHNEGKARVDHVAGHFRFENVSFSYPDTDDSSLREVSLDVPPGQTLAIVGPSGAGKSTLLNLVIGFVRPSSGRILLDGQDMNTLDLRTYRRSLSVVPQETQLFEGTIRENILYGMQDVDEAQLLQAIEDANAREFIDELPRGLDSYIGEQGAQLSGGQRQRIAIARALVRDPRVLILDEATSALDTTSESQIQEALLRLMQNRTTFVVAHRLSTVQNADRIIVLDHGRIVETGTHAELVRRGGVYAEMHSVQIAHLAI